MAHESRLWDRTPRGGPSDTPELIDVIKVAWPTTDELIWAFDFFHRGHREILIPLSALSLTEQSEIQLQTNARRIYARAMGYGSFWWSTCFTEIGVSFGEIDQVFFLIPSSTPKSVKSRSRMWWVQAVISDEPDPTLFHDAKRLMTYVTDDFVGEAVRRNPFIRGAWDHDPSATGAGGTQRPRRFMLIRPRPNGRRIRMVFLVSLALGTVASLVVGLYTRRVDLGVALSAAIYTLISCLHDLTAWYLE